jgi:arsenate reductase
LKEKLGLGVRDFMRKKEAEYKDSGADDASLTDDQLAEKIAAYPKLLERPIVVKGDKAAIGRPPEHVLSIL